MIKTSLALILMLAFTSLFAAELFVRKEHYSSRTKKADTKNEALNYLMKTMNDKEAKIKTMNGVVVEKEIVSCVRTDSRSDQGGNAEENYSCEGAMTYKIPTDSLLRDL